MLQPIELEALKREEDLVPQAILNMRLSDLVRRFDGKLFESQDDLDFYEGVAFSLNGLRFALMHYGRHPEGTVTIYLPFALRDIKAITDTISRIVTELDLPRRAIKWQRSDDPSL